MKSRLTHALYPLTASDRAKIVSCVCTVLLVVFCVVSPLYAVSLEILQKNYQREVDRIHSLPQRTPAASRKEWLTSVNRLRRIYQMSPASLASSCLWQMATTSRDMYLRFQDTRDLDRALVFFRDLANLFPRDTRADNALFTAAKLHITYKNNPQLARRYFKRILTIYPAGDMAAKAQQELSAQPVSPAQASRGIEYRYTVPDEAATLPVAKVTQIQFWTTPSYARVVLRSQGGTSYFSRLLDTGGASAGQTKIIIDMENSVLAPQVRAASPPAHSPLAKIQLSQHTSSSVRAVIALREYQRHKVFSLSDPFRIVIDIQGRTPPPATTTPKTPVPVAHLPEKKPAIPVLIPGFRVKRRPGSGKVPATLSLAKQFGLHVGRVVIDPGHGAHDPGARGHGLVEKDLVLAIAQKTARELQDRYGIEVFLTRKTDVFIPLEERTAMANTNRADLFVSIHINAAPRKNVRGLETYFLNLATDDNAMRLAAYENATSTHRMSELQDILTDLLNNSKKKESSFLAREVQKSMVTRLKKRYPKTKNLGVKQAPFYVLLGAEMPAVLVECFFLSNSHDAAFLKHRKNLDLLASSLATGINRYITSVNQAGRPSTTLAPSAKRRKQHTASASPL